MDTILNYEPKEFKKFFNKYAYSPDLCGLLKSDFDTLARKTNKKHHLTKIFYLVKQLNSRSTTYVVGYRSREFPIAVFKTSKRRSIVAEYENGLKLNVLRNDGCLNFAYMYGCITTSSLYSFYGSSQEQTPHIVYEYINGNSLAHYNKMSPLKFFLVVIQIAMAVYKAYVDTGFIHSDPNAGNIILRPIRPRKLRYKVDEQIYEVWADYITTFIDYDPSSCANIDDWYEGYNLQRMMTGIFADGSTPIYRYVCDFLDSKGVNVKELRFKSKKPTLRAYIDSISPSQVIDMLISMYEMAGGDMSLCGKNYGFTRDLANITRIRS